MRQLFACIFFLASIGGFAQSSTDQQLAVHYYQNGEFDKAHMYFQKLYDGAPTPYYFQYLLKCKLELKDYKEAEKLIKKQQKREPGNLTLYLDLSSLYAAMGDEKRARQESERAIKELTPDYTQITSLGDAFKNRNMIEEALETYNRGGQLLNNKHAFAINKAELYAQKNDHASMLNAYFDLLDHDPSYLSIVQNSLSVIMDFENQSDPKVDLLRTEILKRVQKDPNSEVYTDMMVWFFQQKGDFSSAFNQVKALDKRLKLEGQKAIDFAMLCINNEQFDVAAKAYDYVVQLGSNAPYYFIGQNGLINVLYKQVVNKGYYTQEELSLLETNCKKVIDEFGDVSETVPLKIKLAHIMGFYQHKYAEAIALMDKTLGTPAITESQTADVKMELADLLLLSGSIWDASLYYSQVEKAFKHDMIGHEAKFRNARVFYYSHDYRWAQSQLDVLKTSTSKLIANDALGLSLLITENLGLDSIPGPLNLFSDAELLFFQNKDAEAINKLDTLSRKFPFHSMADDAVYLRFKIAKKRGEYDNARQYLEEIMTKFPQDVLGDDAVFNLAEMYQYHYKDNDKAAELYKKILFDYPGSLYQVEARKRFRILRGEKIN